MLNYHLLRLVRRLAWLVLLAGTCAVAAGALVDWDLRDAALRGLAAEAGGVLLGSAAFLVARKARKAEQTMLAELRRKSLRERKAPRRGFEVVMARPPAPD